MAVIKVRVGMTVPGRLAATWPLVGLRFDAGGFEFVLSALMRLLVGSAIPSTCQWRDVESLRRGGLGVTVRLRAHRQIRITAFSGGKAKEFLEIGRLHGVQIDGYAP